MEKAKLTIGIYELIQELPSDQARAALAEFGEKLTRPEERRFIDALISTVKQ